MAESLWRRLRSLPWWGQLLLWFFLWGPLALLWAFRRRSLWRWGVALVAALFWFSLVVSSFGGSPEPRPTPTTVVKAVATASPRATATPTPELAPTATPALVAAEVVEVVDGDTLKVRIDGHVVTVRLIGVDTPESVDPSSPVQCYAREATAFTRDMVARAQNQVLLERDVSETDQYGRLLRYVWLEHPDGRRMLNYELVSQGFARVATFPPDVRYAELFLQLEREARSQGRGLWGACPAFGAPEATPTPVPSPPRAPSPAQPAQPARRCDPAYPDVCIPPPPPDLDCNDIPYRRFRVLPPDPHGFDRDGDGIGCESR